MAPEPDLITAGLASLPSTPRRDELGAAGGGGGGGGASSGGDNIDLQRAATSGSGGAALRGASPRRRC